MIWKPGKTHPVQGQLVLPRWWWFLGPLGLCRFRTCVGLGVAWAGASEPSFWWFSPTVLADRGIRIAIVAAIVIGMSKGQVGFWLNLSAWWVGGSGIGSVSGFRGRVLGCPSGRFSGRFILPVGRYAFGTGVWSRLALGLSISPTRCVTCLTFGTVLWLIIS